MKNAENLTEGHRWRHRRFEHDRQCALRGVRSEEYVKVCSLYGAGYYYMPGTDICIKLGGYVRYQFTANPGSSITAGPFSGAGGLNNRATSLETAHRTRALITVDTRQQTAYGTLRTYILLGYSQDSTAPESTSPAVYMTRGFLQIAGFTFGKATSFFDVVPGASFAYNAGMFFHPDTGDAGKMLAAYTAQFGNGVSGTIALEQARARGISRVGDAGTVLATGNTAGNSPYALGGPFNQFNQGGAAGVSEYPDLVGNIRIDQSWGTWLVGGALHINRAGYWGGSVPGCTTGSLVSATVLVSTLAAANTQNCGGPDSKLGFAVTTGFILNLPMIAPGDRLSAGIVYSEGAVGYAAVTPSGGATNIAYNRVEGNAFSFGAFQDGVYNNVGLGAAACNAVLAGGCGQIQLTTAWSASAAFEHLWTPALRTSLYGSYIDVSNGAVGNALICNAGGGVYQAGLPAVTGCDTNWTAWNIGSRTQWEPVKGLVMGIDVIYNKQNTSNPNFSGLAVGPGTGLPTATTAANCVAGGSGAGAPVPCYRAADMDAVTSTFRIQRDFLP
jgi:hypothetical protein